MAVVIKPFHYRGLYITVTSFGEPAAFGLRGRETQLIVRGATTEVLHDLEARQWANRYFAEIVKHAETQSVTSWDTIPWAIHSIHDPSARQLAINKFLVERYKVR